jgi:succinate dehydrogenase/fumarate reductase flavoprotein subunit
VTGTDYDVLIVGSGAAGLSAAFVAGDLGANLLLVEGQDSIGGPSALYGGVIIAAGTSIQRKAGIEHTAEGLFHDSFANCMVFGKGCGERPLRHTKEKVGAIL